MACENSPMLCIQVVLEVIAIICQKLEVTPLKMELNRLVPLSNLDIIFGNICNETSSVIEIMYNILLHYLLFSYTEI